MVEVIAPATLKAGYIFNAKYDGIVFPVVVVSSMMIILFIIDVLNLFHGSYLHYSFDLL